MRQLRRAFINNDRFARTCSSFCFAWNIFPPLMFLIPFFLDQLIISSVQIPNPFSDDFSYNQSSSSLISPHPAPPQYLLLSFSVFLMGLNVLCAMWVMSCHVMSCHAMSCHVMPCHVMSCHVMSWLSSAHWSTSNWGRFSPHFDFTQFSSVRPWHVQQHYSHMCIVCIFRCVHASL